MLDKSGRSVFVKENKCFRLSCFGIFAIFLTYRVSNSGKLSNINGVFSSIFSIFGKRQSIFSLHFYGNIYSIRKSSFLLYSKPRDTTDSINFDNTSLNLNSNLVGRIKSRKMRLRFWIFLTRSMYLNQLFSTYPLNTIFRV